MAAAVRSESVRVFGKCRFIDGFKQHTHDFFHQPVICGGDAQRTLFAVFLPDIRPAGRLRLVAAVFDGRNDGFNSRYVHSVQGDSIRARRHAALRFGNILIGQQIEFRVVQIPV